MLARVAVRLRKLRRWFTRSYWELRVIPLSKSEGTATSQGLIFVQIDGLSQKQFRRALSEGHLPFLKRLMEREKYTEYAHYSGLPSATPAVQGELFYGVKSCVPAFNFLDRESGQIFIMYNPKSASEMESRLARENRALLEGGSSYSNIFSGGAAETHFCAATFGWQGFFKLLRPVSWIFLFIFHIDILVRTLALLVIEFVLAVWDCMRGIIQGQHFIHELQFILTRVLICVLLREFILLGAKIDIARGLPIIHVNFFGYDEQSHRRGPSSAFAHWSLQGIDKVVSQLWQAAQLAERRDYDLWIYSDHGQEDTLPYPVEHSTHVEDAIAEVFGQTVPKEIFLFKGHRNYACYSGKYSVPSASKILPETPRVTVTGMGPFCQVYPCMPLSMEEKIRIAGEIIQKARVPLVLIPEGGEQVHAITASAAYKLPQDAAAVLGHDHPFLAEVTKDLVNLCHHPNAGEMIVSGWLANEKPRTFPLENGSHAGFGSEETNGFALLPQDAPLPVREHEYLRPLDLREAALRLLGRYETGVTYDSRLKAAVSSKFLRIVCYNVHGCVGMDGKISPQRIARVIARHQADAIALQELDAGCKRSEQVHQAETIAKKLQMDFHFYPSFCLNGHYGNGILSRHPMRLVKVGPLPQLYKRKVFEPRGALWVELDLEGTKVQLMNTHLSLWSKERLMQIEELLGAGWISNPLCRSPLILTGDFNAGPQSQVYKRISSKLYDAQLLLEFHRPHGTWRGPHHFARIDHLFVSSDIRVGRIFVPRTELDQMASDHFPLIIDLEIPGFFKATPTQPSITYLKEDDYDYKAQNRQNS